MEWGWQKDKNKKNINISKIWKGIILALIMLPILSFFSFIHTVKADKEDFYKNLNKISLEQNYQNNLPISVAKLIIDWKKGKNILKDNKAITLALNHLNIFIQLAGLGNYNKQIHQLIDPFLDYKNDIFKILGKNKQTNYLIIFENTSEERPDGGFFGSFASISFSGGHITNFKIYDSYYLLWKWCGKNGIYSGYFDSNKWWQNCPNKNNLNIPNNLSGFNSIFPKTTWLTSNIFAFTDLNAKNIAKHYLKLTGKKIDGVIFVKSDLLKYIVPDGEKLLWQMELNNYLAKIKATKISKKNKDILGLKGKKAKYLLQVNKIINNKKELIKNFIKNYPIIQKRGLIRAYFFNTSKKFNQKLNQENLSFLQNPHKAYLFFYNLGFNKISKFVDHIILVNNKVYVNPQKGFSLKLGQNKISFKNIINDKSSYRKFLQENNVEKSSYLRSKKLIYKELLILPKNCKLLSKQSNNFYVLCK